MLYVNSSFSSNLPVNTIKYDETRFTVGEFKIWNVVKLAYKYVLYVPS